MFRGNTKILNISFINKGINYSDVEEFQHHQNPHASQLQSAQSEAADKILKAVI